jgi:hypothetical protein
MGWSAACCPAREPNVPAQRRFQSRLVPLCVASRIVPVPPSIPKSQYRSCPLQGRTKGPPRQSTVSEFQEGRPDVRAVWLGMAVLAWVPGRRG